MVIWVLWVIRVSWVFEYWQSWVIPGPHTLQLVRVPTNHFLYCLALQLLCLGVFQYGEVNNVSVML